jgi:pyridoxamine 5'-phosphate oxidase
MAQTRHELRFKKGKLMATEIPADPFAAFGEIYAAATEHELNDPNAMALATVGADGMPSLRIVLLKAWDARGFVFYTNLTSRKGRELRAHPQMALTFHWKSLRKQVRITGVAEAVTDSEADAYFATRARDSQLGAWASLQSAPLGSRAVFDRRFVDVTALYEGKAVPRPPHWSGTRVVPREIEIWHDRDHRLHERWLYVRDGESWKSGLLYP